jgi:hypothetical protein
MRYIITILFILSLAAPCGAFTVGSPEISMPEESLFLKEEAVKEALDSYDYSPDIRTSVNIEVISERELTSADADVSAAEMEGQYYMMKFSTNFYDIVEPYVTLGTSDLKLTWDQYGDKVEVDADPGFVLGFGAKGKLCEFQDSGIKLTLDAQYRKLDSDVDTASLAGSTLETYSNSRVDISEWQVTLLASRRCIIPIGENGLCAVPYAGPTYTSSEIDARFTPSSGMLYSTFDANDDNEFGLVLGLDVMSAFLSHYLLNFELHLINETAFSIGGKVKF